MLGYMTERQAIAEGFTHHGKYFGIPCWIANPDGEMIVATKWTPLEYLLPVVSEIEGFIASILYPEAEPAFQFWVGAEIGKEKI